MQAETLLKAASAQLAANWPPPGVPPKFDIDLGTSGGSFIDPRYTSPYGAQPKIGVQRALRPGLVLNGDYRMNRGAHLGSIVDCKPLGAPSALALAAGRAGRVWGRR